MAHLLEVTHVRRQGIFAGFQRRLASFRRRACTALVTFLVAFSGQSEEPRADLDISGYGIIGSLELRRILKSLDLHWKERATFDANFIEDAALVLLSRLRRDGYLEPSLSVEVTLADGRRMVFPWRDASGPMLPAALEARRVHFKIRKGVRYRFGELHIRGLEALPSREARGFFVEQGVLLPLKVTRIFTPERLQRGMENLTEALQRRGFEQARVAAGRVERNDRTGEVDVLIAVEEGPKSLVRSVRVEYFAATNRTPILTETTLTNAPYSRMWQQDLALALRNTNYHRGYPDTTVAISELERERYDSIAELDLLARVQVGHPVRVAQLRFEGLEKTRRSVAARSVGIEPGEPLNPIEVERGRNRLLRLGTLDSVSIRYDLVNDHYRDVIYVVDEGRRFDVSLLLGYGSYELARAGVELEQFNLFGRAHHARLRAVQSVKSTSADYRYTMPEFIGERVDVFANAFFLDRDEVSFVRREFGGGAGARTFVDVLRSDLTVRYNYQILSARLSDPTEGPAEANVGSILVQLDHDRRDSPLYPRRGYKVQASLETASEWLGGDVNFWKWEIQGAYHRSLDEGRWLHFGAAHGAVLTLHGSRTDLPFNKRFFPGGDNSVRGFQFGEAAPRNAFGQVVGAETYTLGNIEFEQALTEKLSLVFFVDAIGFARRIEDYPFAQSLVSAGGGLRWKTIVGPVRLEYGHNLVRRDDDPGGTLHITLGFPF